MFQIEPEKAARTQTLVEDGMRFTRDQITSISVPLQQKAQELLDDKAGLFAIDFQNVPEFARTIAPRICLLGNLYGQLLVAEQNGKAEIDKLELAVKRKRASVMLRNRENKAFEKDTVPIQAARVDSDPEVQAEEENLYAFRTGTFPEILELKNRVYYTLKSLQALCDVLPGMQGLVRDFSRNGGM